ncbi:GNAT family N-acetyltransferase [archaeon]|nr:MAG: GNAT family N-acetyltransferase [archaeon]
MCSVDVSIADWDKTHWQDMVAMVRDFFNMHRALTGSSEDYWETDGTAAETLDGWVRSGKIYSVLVDGRLAGFLHVRFGGHDAVWLEGFFVDEEHRGRGVGRRALSAFDDEMARQGKKAVFVDVIPRNERALSFYRECGFDHLNMVQLRKNYDHSLDKDEHVDALGMRWRKY